MNNQRFLDRWRELLKDRFSSVRDWMFPEANHVIVIDQGGWPKDGTLWVDGKEVLFMTKFNLSWDLKEGCLLTVDRILPGNERIEVVLRDVPAKLKTTCVYCGSEKIEHIPGRDGTNE